MWKIERCGKMGMLGPRCPSRWVTGGYTRGCTGGVPGECNSPGGVPSGWGCIRACTMLGTPPEHPQNIRPWKIHLQKVHPLSRRWSSIRYIPLEGTTLQGNLLEGTSFERYTLWKVHTQKVHPQKVTPKRTLPPEGTPQCWHLVVATEVGGTHPCGMLSCCLIWIHEFFPQMIHYVLCVKVQFLPLICSKKYKRKSCKTQLKIEIQVIW